MRVGNKWKEGKKEGKRVGGRDGSYGLRSDGNGEVCGLRRWFVRLQEERKERAEEEVDGGYGQEVR